MISKIRLFFLILLIGSNIVYSQWMAGVSFNIKSEIPENGFGVTLGRNLPFQWPLLGFMIRAGANLYSTNSELPGKDNLSVTQLKQTNIHLNLLGTFYPRYIYPYAGIGFGFGSLSYETKNQGTEEFIYTRSVKNYFYMEGLTGIRLSFLRNFYPYFEIHLLKYFTSFSDINNGISSLQLSWCFGLEIGFDTL